MRMRFSLMIAFVIFAVLIISGCTQPATDQTPAKQTPAQTPSTEQPIIKLSTGNHIVDSRDMTLYLFTKDVMGDSKCTGGCLNSWPIFYQEKISVSTGLQASDFGTITRDDGKKQTTYSG